VRRASPPDGGAASRVGQCRRPALRRCVCRAGRARGRAGLRCGRAKSAVITHLAGEPSVPPPRRMTSATTAPPQPALETADRLDLRRTGGERPAATGVGHRTLRSGIGTVAPAVEAHRWIPRHPDHAVAPGGHGADVVTLARAVGRPRVASVRRFGADTLSVADGRDRRSGMLGRARGLSFRRTTTPRDQRPGCS
jgi:hypothetical protein